MALFTWDIRVHGFSEPFWLWVEDMDGADILQLEHLSFRQDILNLTTQFHFPVSQVSPQPKVRLRLVSDRWLGAESEIDVPLDDIKMPYPSSLRRRLLDLPLLPISALRAQVLQQNVSQRLTNFNAIQTQAFWPVVNSKQSVIFSAPAGCGKSTLGYISLM
jgi:antiviral helicase SLH1